MKKKKSSSAQSGKIKVSPHVLSRSNADGTVAIMKMSESDYFFTLDGIAADAWTFFDGRMGFQQIASTLAEKHGAPPAKLQKDLQKLIQKLNSEGLLS